MECSVSTRRTPAFTFGDDMTATFLDFEERDREFFEYNALDSAVLPEVLAQQKANLTAQDNLRHYSRTIKVLPALTYMQVRGIRMDKERLARESEKCKVEMERCTEEFLKRTGKEKFNLGSPTQLIEYFYKERGIKPIKGKGGGITTDDDAMKQLDRHGVEEASIVQKYRRAQKMKGTYYDMRLSPEGRLHCQYKPVGTKTARLSSSESFFGYGTNMQNQPYDLKFCCLADEGYLIGEMDLAQAENRIVAWAGPVPEMKDAFIRGIDVHSLTASLILSQVKGRIVEIEEVSDVKGTAPVGNRTWSERDVGKRSNHALNWDMTWMEAMNQWECTAEAAKRIITAYHTAYPAVRFGYHPFIQNMLKSGRSGTSENPFGRKRKFLTPTYGSSARQTFKDAYADYAQSTVGCIINEYGLNQVMHNPIQYRELELLNQVHDSIWFQIPFSIGAIRMAQLLNNLAKSLERPIMVRGDEMSIPVDCKLGLNLGDAKKIKLGPHLDERLHALCRSLTNTTMPN